MKPIVYNISMAAGIALVSAGAFLQWGAGIGAIVAGSLVLGCTVVGAHLSAKAA